MTSVSLEVWKIEPCASSSARSSVGVDEVAVVGDRDRPAGVLEQERLGVAQLRAAGGRVADVADRRTCPAAWPGSSRLNASLTRPIATWRRSLPVVGGDQPGGLLPAVLEGMHAQVRDVGRFVVAVDAEHPAHGRALTMRRLIR